jgi:hypothetical protein
MTRDERREAFKAKSRLAAAGQQTPWSKPTTTAVRKSQRRKSRPAYGSQQWAETCGDDLGESFD